MHSVLWYSRSKGKLALFNGVTQMALMMFKLGLRAIASSRYSFGFYGAKLCSVLNILIGAGFSVVNLVTTGGMLSAVSGYSMTISVGIIIIAIISYVISIFGFKMIHQWEKYSWIVTAILLIILIAQIGPKLDTSLPSEASGLELSGNWLSFFAVCFSSASGWCSIGKNSPMTTCTLLTC